MGALSESFVEVACRAYHQFHFFRLKALQIRALTMGVPQIFLVLVLLSDRLEKKRKSLSFINSLGNLQHCT